MGNPGKSGKIWFWGLGGVWGGHFIVNFKERVATKIRKCILLHFGLLVAFRFHFEKTRKPFSCMVFGPAACDHGPNTKYFKLWIHQMGPNNSKKLPNDF